jgi:hypothetical protein
MQVQVVRRGGFAGLALRGAVDTASLPATQRGRIEAALGALPFDQPPAAPSHPDSFQYEISLDQGPTPRRAVIDEAHLPEVLRPVIDAAFRGSG